MDSSGSESFLLPVWRRSTASDTLEVDAMRRLQLLLTAGATVPLLYFGTIALAGLLSPDYNHVSQYASELGMAGSPSAGLFNSGILLTALATMAGSFGFYLAARALSPGRLWPILAGISLGLFGVGLAFGALFPMPDPRHGGFGLGMSVHVAPLFLALALRSAPDLGTLRRFLIIVTILMFVFLLPMMGIGGLVTKANVGAFQRLYALMVFGWIGVAGLVLLRSSNRSSA